MLMFPMNLATHSIQLLQFHSGLALKNPSNKTNLKKTKNPLKSAYRGFFLEFLLQYVPKLSPCLNKEIFYIFFNRKAVKKNEVLVLLIKFKT